MGVDARIILLLATVVPDSPIIIPDPGYSLSNSCIKSGFISNNAIGHPWNIDHPVLRKRESGERQLVAFRVLPPNKRCQNV